MALIGRIDHVSCRAWWEMTLLHLLYGRINAEVKKNQHMCFEEVHCDEWSAILESGGEGLQKYASEFNQAINP